MSKFTQFQRRTGQQRPVKVRWLKGHGTRRDVQLRDTTDLNIYGNDHADKLTDQGLAKHGEVFAMVRSWHEICQAKAWIQAHIIIQYYDRGKFDDQEESLTTEAWKPVLPIQEPDTQDSDDLTEKEQPSDDEPASPQQGPPLLPGYVGAAWQPNMQTER